MINFLLETSGIRTWVNDIRYKELSNRLFYRFTVQDDRDLTQCVLPGCSSVSQMSTSGMMAVRSRQMQTGCITLQSPSMTPEGLEVRGTWGYHSVALAMFNRRLFKSAPSALGVDRRFGLVVQEIECGELQILSVENPVDIQSRCSDPLLHAFLRYLYTHVPGLFHESSLMCFLT